MSKLAKYKICRRLGSSVFTKCQTAKYTLSEERRGRGRRRRRSRSNFGEQLLEKQKVRFTYGMSERQFASYVKEAIEKGTPAQYLFNRLESRLDNVVFRMGYAESRAMARQLVSHGHFKVNGKRLNVPSHFTKVGDVISLKEASQDSPFAEGGNALPVSWLEVDMSKHNATITGQPTYDKIEQNFDLTKVIEFYSR